MTVLTKYRLAYEAMHAAAVAARDTADTTDAADTADTARSARETAVREAFRASGCDEARETALICAPQETSDLLEDVYATLRDLQDVFAAGDPPLGSPELQERRLKHAAAVWAARAALRRDLDRAA